MAWISLFACTCQEPRQLYAYIHIYMYTYTHTQTHTTQGVAHRTGVRIVSASAFGEDSLISASEALIRGGGGDGDLRASDLGIDPLFLRCGNQVCMCVSAFRHAQVGTRRGGGHGNVCAPDVVMAFFGQYDWCIYGFKNLL